MATRKIADLWLRKILQAVYQRRSVTRTEIVRVTGLNLASVSHAMRFLLRHGTIVKLGDLEAEGGGRRREVFSLNGEAAYFIAVDLEGERIRFALLNFSSDVRYRWEEHLGWSESLDARKICAGMARILAGLPAPQKRRVIAAGISYPGLLDEHGHLTAVNLGWKDYPLLAELKANAEESLAGLPIFIEPHRHSSVLAERWLGAAQDIEDGFLLFGGRGIGIGILTGGRRVEGWRGIAGEIGHSPVDPNSEEECKCGMRGCLETVASTPSILRAYERRTGRQAGLAEIYDRARRGEADAVAVLERAAAGLALALSHAVSLLNPRMIVLGGDLAVGEDVLVPLIRAGLSKLTMPALLDRLTITTSTLGLDLRLKGAAAFAFRRALADPVLLKTICGPVLHRAAKAGAR